MTSQDFSAYQLRTMMRNAEVEEMNLDETLNETIALIIKSVCNASQPPHECLPTLLLPAIGHLMIVPW